MKYRPLGRTGWNVSEVSFGAWAIGGGRWEFGWGPQDDEQSIAAIRAGLDLGINWIDTAAAYGLGHSEKIVGRAVRGLRYRPYIFTKCSLVWDGTGKIVHNLQADSIRRECEASLERLEIDAIDLYQIHWPAWKGAPESASPGSIEEAVGMLSKLKDQGKIRYIGVSNFDVQKMERAQRGGSHRFSPAALLPCRNRCGDIYSSLCPQPADWRNRVFTDGIRTPEWSDDARAHRGDAG